MAVHSSVLAWRIPWTEEPGGLQSLGSYTHTKKKIQTHTFLTAHAALTIGPFF